MKQVRRNEEERRRLVSEWRESGTSIATFCEGNGISSSSFKRWQAEFGKGCDVEESFLPVVVRTDVAQGGVPCKIRIGGFVVIECDGETSGQAVETAIRAAVAACGPMLGA